MSVAAPAIRPTTLPYYPALTGLRTVAAYFLFFYHFGLPQALLTPLSEHVTRHLYVSTDMLCVLSGFVIATRYQSNITWTRTWWRGYLWRRFARIYPVYFILNTLVLAYVYLPVRHGQVLNNLLLIFLSETLLRGFSSTLKFVGLPQAWSLTVEECFYLSAPFLLLAWRRWGGGGILTSMLAVLSIGLGLTALLSGQPELHGLFGSYKHLFNYTFFGRVSEFVVGIALARWWAARPLALTPRWPWRTALGIVLMATTLGILVWIDSPLDWYDGLRYPSAIAVKLLVFPLGMAWFMAGLLAERSWLYAVLATRIMQLLGRSSYFFYLVHIGVFSIWWRGVFGREATGWQFLATVLISVAGFRLLEEPLRRWVLARTLGNERTSHDKGDTSQAG
ncbi:MAG: acyltransferase family protein [Janthinobacterium lividum]